MKQTLTASLKQWLVADNPKVGLDAGMAWMRVAPFIALHIAAGAAFVVGVALVDVLAATVTYLVRMFAITAFYHRYFAHRAFETSRGWQFFFALIGASAAQRGPLWWSAMHRRHHAVVDTDADVHAPHHGFLRSHLTWFLTHENFATDERRVRDWACFPELRWLDRFDALIPIVSLGLVFGIGAMLERFAPHLGTTAVQFTLWSYCVSTVLLLHVTLAVNSLAHRFGTRRFETKDRSRNLRWLAWLTLGEGWHNNHHRYAGAARQGFFAGETDVSYQVLRLLEWLGVVRNLRVVPERILAERGPR